MRLIVRCQPAGKLTAGFDEFCRDLGTGVGIDPPAQPEEIDVVVEIDDAQHVENSCFERGRIGNAGYKLQATF